MRSGHPPEATERLELALRQNPDLCDILDRFDAVALPDCWLVAGAVAQTVWNLAAGRAAGFSIKDVDLVYFGVDTLSADAEAAQEARLRRVFPGLTAKLDVKNQARVHLWYETVFGYPIPPYRSTEAAIATFPTLATCVGVRYCQGGFEICAPFGLDDLFDGIVRPNKRQITRPIYEAKTARWKSIWPALTILPWDDADEPSRA
jgi:hypothetical protein